MKILVVLMMLFVTACSAKSDEPQQFVKDFATDYSTLTYNEQLTLDDADEYTERVKSYFTEEGYDSFVKQGASIAYLKEVVESKSNMKTGSVTMDKLWEDNDEIGYKVVIDVDADDLESENLPSFFRLSVKKIDNEWKIYAFEIN